MTVFEFYERVRYNEGLDRKIKNWDIIDIHDLTFAGFTEADFYCCDNSRVILLRIVVNKNKQKLTIVNNGNLPYWIAEIEGSAINNSLLQELLLSFSQLVSQ